MTELAGWIGAICFAACGVPQAVKVWRTQQTRDLSWGFLWLWLGGEVLSMAYVLDKGFLLGVWQWPLLVNYFFCGIVTSYLVLAKWRYDP